MWQSDNIDVMPVAPHLVDAMWPHVCPYLTKGLAAATTSTLDEIRQGIDAGTDTLWTVFEGGLPVAAFMTAVHGGGLFGDRFLSVYALGGYGLPRWAKSIDLAMQAEAKRRDLEAIRFAGRKAWGRVLPDLKVQGEINGHTVYERAAA